MGPYRAIIGPYWGLNGALVGLWGHGALLGPYWGLNGAFLGP